MSVPENVVEQMARAMEPYCWQNESWLEAAKDRARRALEAAAAAGYEFVKLKQATQHQLTEE